MTTAIQPIETQRLLLRRLEANDFAAFHEILGDPRVGKWLGRSSGFTLADSKNLWDNIDLSWEEEGFGPWGVILKAEEKLVGYCGLHFSDEYSEIELRYALHAEYWNQGYTFEAAQKALELGFDVFQFPTIISYTLPENIASRRIMEKLGMKQEKEFEHKGLKHVWYRV